MRNAVVSPDNIIAITLHLSTWCMKMRNMGLHLVPHYRLGKLPPEEVGVFLDCDQALDSTTMIINSDYYFMYYKKLNKFNCLSPKWYFKNLLEKC